jgi:CheY-like chemotaxis protein/KaiC/GvpD/RAD55 family RecA-like ATPase
MAEKKLKILLADDEENIRLLGEKLLREAGYVVILAANGDEAVEKAISEKPDLVITDIKMPKKTGFEVCKALRSDPVLSRVPILILSALGDEFNKLTGFEGGANDFITKPFRTEELKERVALLLEREIKSAKRAAPSRIAAEEEIFKLTQIPTGVEILDKMLGGGLPKGSNILLIGPLGRGKSTFARRFIAEGLSQGEKCLFVAVDDDPILVRSELKKMTRKVSAELENNNALRFVDAYTWTSAEKRPQEKYRIEGVLNLEQLSDLISRAGNDIGQSVQQKSGGRRVVDSISSLFVNFELPAVQRFLSQIGHTALAFGGVTTLFVLEEGSVSEQIVNNIKYLMDGVLEFKEDLGKKRIRVSSMKWFKFGNEWFNWQL